MEMAQQKPSTDYTENTSDVARNCDFDLINHELKVGGAANLRLDKHDLPLVPQPTIHKDDPLVSILVSDGHIGSLLKVLQNWSPLFKLFVCLQICWLACIAPMSSAVINPAFVPLGKAFGITTVQASYELTVYLIFAGVGPLFVTPFANVYGRRPVYLLGNLLAGVTNIIAANCTTWNGILITRVFSGIGGGSTVAIGAASICDLYFMHERGVFMGIYTFFLTNGPHIAPLIGGFVAQSLSWRWCFSIPAYIQLGTFVFTLFFLPETLYSRGAANNSEYKSKSYFDLLVFKGRLSDRTLHLRDFLTLFYMLKYVAVFVSGLYYMTSFTYGTVLFASTGANLFAEFYHFNVAQTGLILSIPLLIGCLIGEFSAGWVTDWMAYRYMKRHDGNHSPEARLDAIWLALLIPIGVVTEGVCLSHSKTVGWIGSAFGMGIACLGLQVATTVVYVYTTDCYKPQSAEISTLLNTFRQIFSALVSFYAISLGTSIGIQYAWLVLALTNVVFLLPMFALRIYGHKWRALAWQSPPKFQNDI